MTTPSSRPTILHADDDDLLRRLISRTMQQAEIEVLSAADGVEALRLIEENRDRIQAIFTDFQMGGYTQEEAIERDGLTLIHAINQDPDERIRTTPKVMLTGAEELMRELARERGVSMENVLVLQKPFDIGVVQHLAEMFCRQDNPSEENPV